MKRAGLGIDRYVKLEDPSKSSYRWVEFVGKKLERGPEFEKEYGKYYGIIIKLEYLKNHGMIPFGAAIQQGNCFLLFDKRTFEKAKPILDIPDEKIEKMATSFERTIDIINSNVLRDMALENTIRPIDDEEWMEVTR